MALYETVFIVRQDVSVQDVDKLTEQFSEIITSKGGNIIKTEYWGLRSLAYLVKKNKKGHYVLLAVDAPFEAIQEMERVMYYDESVLRKMTVRLQKLDDAPSPMVQTRGGKDEAEDAA